MPIVYLDESGDLGWNFEYPYRAGGSSRHLTISSLLVSNEKKDKPKRLVKRLYQKFKWDTKTEKKWSKMTLEEREYFATHASNLIQSFPDDIQYHSIVVKKERVQSHIRTDSNKLYNYMIGLSLLEEMSKHNDIMFVPDPRSIKVQSGNSLHDYLLTKLWFDHGAQTQLQTRPLPSDKCLNLQFADMLSGLVQHHFEDGNSSAWQIAQPYINCKTLFFR
ncbi:DUF3800 domain-containing protein [Yersinia enterocolitica]|uniref:DUF3800 domain-containing protein n=1 Tax=Yersinia enterocolitica TaxID=630 RepID=UPI001C60EDEC|nr:DUF3800 domain-containing protein [Yersinia enterocolitica]MBW5853102.1 DUF3800 domain-containing protein [Yersinia enterocolitica]